ncbi:hypothetical protein KZ813_16955 [Sphingomonas sp. RHCKR7]|uniref:hypothetical protein n=1 Tax=Sphingomonas folli TaxID=2862497 RepID=UPI001CA59842|nr:hypothetical protein [Sphingomonas folli]MBW6528534.1 hypothetical protein [Sphingomonas folli]
MIRIHKGAAPEILTRLGPGHVEAHRQFYDLNATEIAAGTKKIPVAEHVYGAPEVRDALAQAQHGKCCFCEVEIEHPYMHRHVEHWRPKGGVSPVGGGRATPPGYYWLAYDWENLLLACVVCNSSNKGTSFPLVDEADRARTHHDPIAAERPLLIKPDEEDPAGHMEWIDDQPRGTTDAGWTTIEVLGLIRPEDVKRTRRFLEIAQAYRRLWKIHDVDDPTVREIAADLRRLLEAAPRPESPFSAMATAFLESRTLPPEA